ncbi:cysteine desulfurase family protein [Brevundimonas fluminis]|uniref:cysteine desulfurase family protein n=1 Tax=Brevundimonas fluminis TaxID=2487274 RepID=UPI000F656898|nr:cysteine desulfurase family protein [Brevundimonas fluminis]
MTPSPIYLDYQASTPIDPRVSELVTSVSVASFANPHAEDHAGGWSAASVVEQARSRIATAIGAADGEIVFTSGATEADNLGVLGAALGAPPYRRRILISAFEHKAVLECARACEPLGFTVDMIPILPTGLVDLDRLEDLMGEDVAVVSVMAVNNEIGTIQPIAEVVARAEPFGAFVHTDATQAPLAMDLDMLDWGVDAASFSSHKLYGPKGVGALYLSSTAPWRPRPLMFGGGQEGGLRPGTLPTPLCAGFGLAMTLLSKEERSTVESLRERLAHELIQRLPDLVITCEAAPRHPGCLHLRLPGRDAKDWVTRLQPTVQVAAGSACTSGVMHGSHVLMSLGWSADAAHEGLRLSLGRFTTVAEVRTAAGLIAAAARA